MIFVPNPSPMQGTLKRQEATMMMRNACSTLEARAIRSMLVKLPIRSKFIGILMLAAALPLVLAVSGAELLGYRAYRRAQSTLFHSRANGLAESLRVTMSAPIEALDDWVVLADVGRLLMAEAEQLPAIPDVELPNAMAEIEARWPGYGLDDPLLSGILENSLSAQLRTFIAVNPLVAEAFITDRHGRLVAATGKTTDYWQADEGWWQRAFALKAHVAVVEGIHFDESARVYSLDVALPIQDWKAQDSPPLGVVKCVINATPLLATLGAELPDPRSAYRVVLGDGRILASINGQPVAPLAERIAPALAERLRTGADGHAVTPVAGDEKEVIGYAPLRFSAHQNESVEITGLTPLFVLVTRPAKEVFGPVQQQILLLGLIGAALVLGFTAAGYFIAELHILRPLEALRTAAAALAGTAKLEDTVRASGAASLPALEPLRRIRTGDELEALANEFAYMAGRVLTYHDRLESEIATKTAEINRDLELARDFQEALMPHGYPRVPSPDQPDAVALEFHHLYQPASSVGGDFFDVLKLSDHRAGIFIADVMGHGARSALVTAILRALLQNLAARSDEPATFLSALNQHFKQIVRNSTETIFATAFYLVIDTQASTATYSSAGHPSPLLADRATGNVEPLVPSLRGNPALGVFSDATYQQWSRPVRAGEVFVLLTDGVHESANADGVEFGIERLKAILCTSLREPSAEIGRAIVSALRQFVQPAPLTDDICLVTVEVAAAGPSGALAEPAEAAVVAAR